MGNEPYVVKTHDVKFDAEYSSWIQELKQRYQASQVKAAVKVNSEQLLFNWQLGRDLVTRRAEEKWGKGVVEQVSLDLQAAFPQVNGFSVRNLWNMKKWYSFYATQETTRLLPQIDQSLVAAQAKLQQVAAELPAEKMQQAVAEFLFHALFR